MVHNLDVEPKRKKQKIQSNNTTGYKGVRQYGTKFRAAIEISGKQKGLGTFNTAIAAAHAYDQAAIKAGRKSHTLNFPDTVPIKKEIKTEEVIFDVNSRVKVYWDAEQEWYSGFCKAKVDGKLNYWTVEYDDGDQMDSHISELVDDEGFWV